ncbi:filamentous hemagglutinin family protein [Microbacteriaceae bacterium K1510]|nr:filamentous hemagglutinin family protein [Microbacteriaceae bacterium K1510]
MRDLILVPAGTGGYASDRYYTPGGLLEVSGYLNTTAHTIGEWSAIGGTITLSAPEVIAQAGSVFDISGGSLAYQAGYIRTSNLRGADGRIYNIGNASADMLFSGIAGGWTRGNDHWKISQTWTSPLSKGGISLRWQDGYTVGRDAGRLNLSTPTAIFEGDILADVVTGQAQTSARPADVTDGYKLGQTTAPRAGTLALGQYTATGLTNAYNTDVKFADVAAITAGLDGAIALPADRANTAWFDASALNKAGLGGLDVATSGKIVVDAPLMFANGAKVKLVAPIVDIKADMTARAGSVTVTNIFRPDGTNVSPVALTAGGKAALTLHDDATIDTRGLWTNGVLNRSDLSGLAYLNGGTVDFRSTQDVTIASGSVIDVSSGGAILPTGKTRGGTGGNVTLITNDVSAGTNTGGVLTLDGDIKGYGLNGGGQLSISAAVVLVAAADATRATDQLVLPPDFFRKGFAKYDINGYDRLTVANGTHVDVEMPVYRLSAQAFGVATGADPASALEVWTPPLYLEGPVDRRLVQRAGADVVLQSNRANGSGVVVIAEGSTIGVDPSRSITIQSPGPITVDGTLRAPGGAINIFQVNTASTASGPANPEPGQRSILIGDHAVLDAAGRAVTAVDLRGLRYGTVSDGGTITIGALTKRDNGAGIAQAADAFVVVKSGALLDASGASAVIDLPNADGGSTPVMVASNGGTIALNSFNGLYLDGRMKAAAGGAGALGGALLLTLETARYKDALSVPDDVRFIRELVVGQHYQASASDAPLQIGTARISVDQIAAGGFDTFSAYADVIRFDGSVNLGLGRTIELYHSVLATDGSSMSVRLAAPQVLFKPAAYVSLSGNPVYPKALGLPSQRPTDATLVVDADIIDGYGLQLGGAVGTFPLLSGSRAFDYAGFNKATLNSRGDIRLIGTLSGSKILELNAAQIYPVTGADAKVMADNLVRLGRTSADTPALPYSVFGKLTVIAKAIEQGAVLRAPLGKITLGASSTVGTPPPPAITETVTLLPGSITSVSANGLILPYGGTVDGITYLYAGNTVKAPIETYGSVISGIVLGGKSFTVAEGALLDLSGGGDLRGAGFISGRGGSVDVLTTPLINANPALKYSAKGNQVYAIVPGVQTNYAPIGSDAGALPALGQQITIPNGVPGLPAGTYTLLPARYALMPGAYRVELGGTAAVASGVSQLVPGTWSVQGYQSTANTGARGALPTQLIVTSGRTVRTYSQYNETGYAEFLIADAARLNAPRPILPVDGKTLHLSYAVQPSTDAPALTFDGKALFDPGKGGYGGILRVDGDSFTRLNLEIVAEGAVHTAGLISIDDRDLNAIGATRMSLGSFQNFISDLGYVSTGSFTTKLVVRSGAVLQAPEIFLGANQGGLTIEDNVTITTIGQGSATPLSAADGFSYNLYDSGNNILALSNGLLNFVSAKTSSGTNPGITIGKAALYTEGTLQFVTGAGSKLVLDRDMRFGARYLSFAVPSINIGENAAIDAAAAAHVLPDGLIFNQQLLTQLLQGNQGVGVPKVETLILSAGQSINFFGPASLNTIDAVTGKSSLAELVLNTPAIYGLGNAGDTAKITTGTLIWNGVSDGVPRGGNRQPASLPPPAVVAGGPGTGSGTLDIVADEIVLGYRKFLQPDTQLTLDRLALGFSTVNLTASRRITANNRNTLSVYATGTDAATYAGGTLNLTTPLLTGEAASVSRFITGGALNLAAPAGAKAAATDVLGAEVGLKGQTVTIASTVALPSGKLTVEANGDILLTDAARIDLAGRAVTMVDVKKYSWGGDLILSSAQGNITQAAGSVIDLSARNNRGGSLSATALDAGAGTVVLAGNIVGSASGAYVAGGTLVPYLGAAIDLRAQMIADFAGLNARLNAGGVFGGRSFQIKKEGFNLVVGDEVKANSVGIFVDGGSLTIAGRIGASGAQVGNIRLGGRDGLTLASTAVLDAHGTQLRVDSYGQPIDAPNRANVELTASAGWLVLAPGATIDMRSADSVARGTVTLNAPRRGGVNGTGAGANDIAVDASGPLAILGAKTIALNAFRSYDDAPAGAPSADGRPTQIINQAYLDGIHADSTAFIDAALANAALIDGRLAGLRTYRDAFHLRPGVEIKSATPNGNLVVEGDLDLSGYRYASLNPNTQMTGVYGSGEVGQFTLRAGGDVTVKGSINDGFAPPPATPDDHGWLISTFIRPGEPLVSDINDGGGLVFEVEYQMPDNGSFVITTDGGWYDSSTGPVPVGATVMLMSLPAGSPSPFTLASTAPRPEPGKMWAVSPMLAAGSQSWSMRLVSGADVGAVDSRALQSTKAGNFVLDDEHFSGPAKTQLATSVIRTGTGDLDLVAGGDFNMKTLFGVYTAGTQSANVDPAFNQPRGTESRASGGGGPVLGAGGTDYESLVAGSSSVYQAWYPELGGNLLVKAQGDITGFNAASRNQLPSTNVGNWLWRQGGDVSGLPTAWWINFGTYVLAHGDNGGLISGQTGPQLAAFSGFGALGGGNVAIAAGGDAGVITGIGANGDARSQGLTVAVGGTGRVINGQLVQTGGGDLSFKVGGTLNPLDPFMNPSRSDAGISMFGGISTLRADLNGVLTNLRGALGIDAGAIGRIDLGYGLSRYEFKVDPRPIDLTTANAARSNGGPLLVMGDTTAMFSARGDVVLSGANDAGRTSQQNATPYSVTSNGVTTSYTGGGYSWFSLWTGNTAIDLFAAGGNLTPTTIGVNGPTTLTSTDGAIKTSGDYPSILRAVAASGSVYYGARLYDPNSSYVTALVLAPSPRGQLEILAQGSIYTLGMPIDMSGADMSVLPAPFRPGFYGGATEWAAPRVNNASPAGAGNFYPLSLFTFGPNTIVGDLHAGDAEPQRFYAVTGDIVGLHTGEIIDFTNGGRVASSKPVNNWYVAAKPVRIIAGRDIVGAGELPQIVNGQPEYKAGNYNGVSSGNIIYHANETDVSVISAGRDIIYANFQVAGPGTLEVSAGRNIYQADKGTITSIGPVVAGDSRLGASIVMQAGVGTTAPDYTRLASLYLDPKNLAATGTPLADQSGKVAKTYERELAQWLKEHYGFAGTLDEARTYFGTLAPEQQRVFLRTVYFAELRAGGREYNDPSSSRYGSYLRGRDVIAALFPDTDPNGKPIIRSGDITMFGGSGVRTLFGGDIQMLVPGNGIVIGVEGQVPPASAGIITQGSGNIELYSKGSILLGLSRIMTTYGGDVLAWSAEGDINAGRGSKTTVLYTPPKRVYDKYGNVVLSPQAPVTGAGIATLNPVPGTSPGDVDLIAPLGTIDAGEAGVRSSGNVNLAALQIVNAANIQAQGTTTGIPTVQAPNIGGLTQASNAAGAAAQQATSPAQNGNTAQPSIIIVEVLGFGGEENAPQRRQEEQRRSGLDRQGYDPNSAFKLIGNGTLSEEQQRNLTLEEREKFKRLRLEAAE